MSAVIVTDPPKFVIYNVHTLAFIRLAVVHGRLFFNSIRAAEAAVTKEASRDGTINWDDISITEFKNFVFKTVDGKITKRLRDQLI